MRVKSLKIQGLTKHRSTDMEFPAAGLVVITGDNGSGKSTIIEAVHVCRFGKSLRGTDLWAGPGRVDLETHEKVVYLRKRLKSGRTTLHVEGHPKYQTPGRAMRELAGDAKLWQRCCVFSFEDVTSFARATDSERKRMLEGVLGLQRFDDALKRCREELVEQRVVNTKADAELKAADRHMEVSRTHADTLQSHLEEVGPPGESDQLTAELEAAQAKVLEEEANEATWATVTQEYRDKRVDCRVRVAAVQHQIESCGLSVCGTCDRPFDGYPTHKVGALREEEAELGRLATSIVANGKEAAANASRHRWNRDQHLEKLVELRSQLKAHEQFAPRRIKLELQIGEALAKVETAEQAFTKAAAAVAANTEHTRILEMSSTVLGLKGLRALVLGEALVGLESAANYWLERFSPGVSVSIRPQRELKGGGTTDEISIEFTGVASGHGYKGSSRGERRRQDVALTWALGEVEAAVNGQSESTVWCDEPFDALDADGVEALVGALTEIRERRCVVVISHSSTLVEALRPDAHYHVEDGVVHRRR